MELIILAVALAIPFLYGFALLFGFIFGTEPS